MLIEQKVMQIAREKAVDFGGSAAYVIDQLALNRAAMDSTQLLNSLRKNLSTEEAQLTTLGLASGSADIGEEGQVAALTAGQEDIKAKLAAQDAEIRRLREENRRGRADFERVAGGRFRRNNYNRHPKQDRHEDAPNNDAHDDRPDDRDPERPERFEGYCSNCGRYGHEGRHCRGGQRSRKGYMPRKPEHMKNKPSYYDRNAQAWVLIKDEKDQSGDIGF